MAEQRRVGIEKIWAYPCSMSLDLDLLAAARGNEADYASRVLLLKTRSINPTWEDPVTMAVNAAKPMLTDEDRASIELLVVGTESSPDQGKPLSTFIFRHLDLQPNCRNFETKHACFGGTAALMMAANWVASGSAPGAKALVICTDQGRMHLETRHEYVLGAGSVAMLISDDPKVVEIDLRSSGYWTAEVGDTFRPTSREEAGNTENSVYCYLDALQGAYDHFKEKQQRRGIELDFEHYFKHNIYHMPFCAMAYRAHRTLLKGQRRIGRAEADAHFERKVRPGLKYVEKVGGTYTASTFFALLGLIDSAEDLQVGDRIGMFAYGSGSCAEFYTAHIGPEAKERVARIGMQEMINARYALTIEQYEEVERERTSYIDSPTYEPKRNGLDDHYNRFYADKGYLVLRGLNGFFRTYDWS